MSKLKIELDSAGIQALLKSQEIVDVLQSQADNIRAQLGNQYQTSQHVGKTRANVSVYTEDPDAIQDNAANNTMLQAPGGMVTPSSVSMVGFAALSWIASVSSVYTDTLARVLPTCWLVWY